MHTGKGQLFMWSSTFADMVILGLCWFLCSIPIITIGTATSALYYSVAKRYGMVLENQCRNFLKLLERIKEPEL